jgi:uncharacterized C2H2 Zn-finger protein
MIDPNIENGSFNFQVHKPPWYGQEPWVLAPPFEAGLELPRVIGTVADHSGHPTTSAHEMAGFDFANTDFNAENALVNINTPRVPESAGTLETVNDADDENIRISDPSTPIRRRKLQAESPLTVQRCYELGCAKEFSRPSDLRKHEKSHSRPWKCSVESCKYHEYGWSTEKLRDRHFQDKHSQSPPLYVCQFPPCPYKSKRESNCKQHMEKAHGWTYRRSKNNGKSAKSDYPPPRLVPKQYGQEADHPLSADFGFTNIQHSTEAEATGPKNRMTEGINSKGVSGASISTPSTL